MKFFLKIKSYQLFILMLLPLLGIFIKLSPLRILLAAFSHLIFVGYFFSVGLSLYKKFPKLLKTMNLPFFKFNLFFYFFYSCFIRTWFDLASINILSNQASLILILYAMFNITYLIYFVAKSLVIAEKKQMVTFRKWFSTFLALGMLFIGIWLVQPRVNKIFD